MISFAFSNKMINKIPIIFRVFITRASCFKKFLIIFILAEMDFN